MKPSDVLVDLGCGDASLLIYAVKKCNLAHAVGFENMKSRSSRARARIKEACLERRIVIQNEIYGADLSSADVIIDMMPEDKNDLRLLYSEKMGLKKGSRLIKHDLPLIGYLPDKIEPPFYMMKYPFRKAKSRKQWADAVLLESNATPDDLWFELYYYGYEKLYNKIEIQDFEEMLRKRVTE